MVALSFVTVAAGRSLVRRLGLARTTREGNVFPESLLNTISRESARSSSPSVKSTVGTPTPMAVELGVDTTGKGVSCPRGPSCIVLLAWSVAMLGTANIHGSYITVEFCISCHRDTGCAIIIQCNLQKHSAET